MIKRRWGFNGKPTESLATTSSSSSTATKEEEVEWEMRPGGMLVQRRSENSEVASPKLRVRVAHGAMRFEVSINSQSTFGELKKLRTAETGLQPEGQRLFFRGKERENGDYLDICGVKDRSKLILVEDATSIERRVVEMQKNAKIQNLHRLISDISIEVDQLAQQVSAIEKSIANGVKVPELQITTLTEMLMRQAVKLDAISAEGDVSNKKILEGKRVQKCVETLDVLKVSNGRVKPVIITTKWETFGYDPPPPSTTSNKWESFD